MKSHEPFVERNMAVLEDRVHSDRELLPACATLPKALTVGYLAILLGLSSNRRQAVRSANLAAMRTARLAIRPALRFKECSGTILVVVGLGYLSQIHGLNSNAQILSD